MAVTVLGLNFPAGVVLTAPEALTRAVDLSRPPGGMVKLVPDSGARPVVLILTGAPERGGGVGGWQSTDRPLRKPARWWSGQPQDTLSLPCMFDLYGRAPRGVPTLDATGAGTVEQRLYALYALGRPSADGDPPPSLRVVGDVFANVARKWVITNLTLGDRLYTRTGALRRQAVTIDLEGYDDLATIRPVAIKRTRQQGQRRARTYVTHRNDTLRSIAVRQLGQSDGWKLIKAWNPRTLRHISPDVRVRAGLRLKLR